MVAKYFNISKILEGFDPPLPTYGGGMNLRVLPMVLTLNP